MLAVVQTIAIENSADSFHDSFMVIVATQMLGLLLDLAHLVLFCLTFILPWRGLAILFLLLEKNDVWLKRKQQKALMFFRILESYRSIYLEELECRVTDDIKSNPPQNNY